MLNQRGHVNSNAMMKDLTLVVTLVVLVVRITPRVLFIFESFSAQPNS